MRNLILVALMVVAVSTTLARSQAGGDCIKPLAPCTQFLFSKDSKPTSECCAPLEVELKNALPCVCSIYGDPTFLRSSGVDSEAALSLPSRCGLKVNLVTYCKAALAPTSPPTTSSLSPSGQPALSPSDAADANAPTTTVSTTPGAKNAASHIGLSGFAVLGSFLMWSTMMLF